MTEKALTTEKKEERPVILVSGGNTTQPLIVKMDSKGTIIEPRLTEMFDVGILYPPVVDQLLAANAELPVFKILDYLTAEDNNFGVNWAATNSAKIITSLTSKRIKPKNRMRLKLPQDKIFKPIADNLVNWFPGYTLTRIASVVTKLRGWKKLWEERDIRLVVVHEDVTEDTRTLVLYAQTQGTPTLHIPHFNHGPGPIGDIHDRLTCDFAAVGGEYMKEWFADRGTSEGVKITGHPQWDQWANFNTDRSWACSMLKLDHTKPVLVYAANWTLWTTLIYDGAQPANGWNTVLEAFKQLDGWQLICKVHPNAKQATPQWHADVAKEANVSCKIVPRNLDIVLQAANIVVSNGFSNVITEAALMNVPGLSMDQGYINEPAAPVCPFDGTALAKAILATHEGCEVWEKILLPNFINRYVGPNDGKATERIIDWCKELADVG